MAERSPLARLLRCLLVYPLEALTLMAGYGVFRLLPLDAASALGGWLGRTIGPRLGVSRRALANLEHALPGQEPAEICRLILGMWDNLGRVMGEYPHIETITGATGKARIELVGADQVAALQTGDGAAILFSGHFGNWELLPGGTAWAGLPCAQTYRTPNNPLVAGLLSRIRGQRDDDSVAKGAAGARKALAVLGEGRRLGMLVDQKMNDGIEVPFFGCPAMTVAAPAQLALRFKCRLVPVRLERTSGCHFRMTVFAPLDLPQTDDRQGDTRAVMTEVNQVLERWIREQPEQWLWLHNRWPN